MMSEKLKVEEFIRRAKETHGDRYDYSQTEYNGYTAKLKIICKKHGEFYQKCSHHIKGANCPTCSKKERYTNDRYIEEARKVHGNKYDYSKVNYINNKTKIEIICPTHGSFFKLTSHHLSGRGCPDCSTAPKQLTTEKFIERSRKAHGDKYNYSLVEYTNQYEKVKIICPIHGEFLQCAKTHMNGFGCSKCAGVHKYTTEEFIKEAKKIHGEKYDYSEVDYKHNRKKIKIICKKHGAFWQKPNNHLSSGSDCPTCARSYISKEGTEWLDFLGVPKEYREKRIQLYNGRIVRVDAFDEKNKIVYEYDSYFWHGSPNMNLEKTHPITGKIYKKLYEKTIKRRNAIIKSGYFVIYTYGE